MATSSSLTLQAALVTPVTTWARSLYPIYHLVEIGYTWKQVYKQKQKPTSVGFLLTKHLRESEVSHK